MILYSFPLLILSALALWEENRYKKSFLLHRNIYLLTCILLTFFIGLRTEIGCDWNQYVINFEVLSSKSWLEILKNNHTSFNDIGYGLINKVIAYKFNFEILVFIFSIFFSLPLFILCKELKRPYLALSIAYPYFIVVVGMGPIRQAAAIGFIILAILSVIKNKQTSFFLWISIASLLHFSAIIFSCLTICFTQSLRNKKLLNFLKVFFLLIILFFIFHNFETFYTKIYYYIKIYNDNSFGIGRAYSAYFIWLINILPSSIYLANISKFKFNKNLHRTILFFSIYEILLFLLIFLNNVLAYRLLLYCFPISIYISSNLPDKNFLGIASKYLTCSIIVLSLTTLSLWLKFANHAYCWLPYQNIILNF